MTKVGKAKAKKAKISKAKTKTEQIVGLLGRTDGASIAELMKVTGWQAHSVRGFMSGHLKKHGRSVQSDMDENGTRRYRLEVTAS